MTITDGCVGTMTTCEVAVGTKTVGMMMGVSVMVADGIRVGVAGGRLVCVTVGTSVAVNIETAVTVSGNISVPGGEMRVFVAEIVAVGTSVFVAVTVG